MSPQQQKWLDGLVCERISSDEANDELRLAFDNERVQSLIDYICGPDVMEEDKRGDLAVYVVKEQEQIIAFFTIQCGLIFESVIKGEDLKFYRIFSSEGSKSGDDKNYLLNYQATRDLSDDQMRKRADEIGRKINSVRPKKNDELKFEISDDVTLVTMTIPGIEIVHLCKNENYVGDFDRLFPGMRLGEVIFY